jgi:NTE family protein
MLGTIIFKAFKILTLWPIHIALLIFSVAIAIVFAALFWIIWLFVHWFDRPKESGMLKSPDMEKFKNTVEKLVGLQSENIKENKKREIDAVFEGGGVKALAQIGAVQVVEKLDLQFSLLGGTSGGAIISSALAVGKNSADIWDLLGKKGLHNIVKVWYLPKVGFLQKKLYFYLPLLANLVFSKGLVSGNTFKEMMNELLKDKPRFKDIPNPEYQKDEKEPLYRLKMLATDISRGIPVVLPDDLPDYWESWEQARKNLKIDPEKLTRQDAQDWYDISDAVRMSMSIPFFFTPVRLHLNVESDGVTPKTDGMGEKGQPVYIVDGGVCSNFPIWLFDRLDKRPPWPTFGFLLDEKKGQPNQYARITGLLLDLAFSVVGTGIGAMDKHLSEHDKYRTVRLSTSIFTRKSRHNTPRSSFRDRSDFLSRNRQKTKMIFNQVAKVIREKKISTTNFGLSINDQKRLVERGAQDTIAKFNEFMWNDYINKYRK